MNDKFDIPVLMVTFNRPSYARQVFESIKQLKPSKLYIFSDGARDSKEGEKELVAECRAIFEPSNFTWECDVQRKFSDKNLGCGLGLSSSITWAFESTEKLIILEDDCVANASFFNYCKTMLDKYENNEQVMHVSGTRWNEEFNTGENGYFFSKIGHVWGWATWKRAWKHYDYNISSWNRSKDSKMILDLFGSRIQAQFWINNFIGIVKQNEIKYHNTWDYQWQYTIFKHGGAAIVPNVNLISNIGIQGVHANENDTDQLSFNKETVKWEGVQSQIQNVDINSLYDSYHMKKYFMRNCGIIKNLKFFVKSFTN